MLNLWTDSNFMEIAILKNISNFFCIGRPKDKFTGTFQKTDLDKQWDYFLNVIVSAMLPLTEHIQSMLYLLKPSFSVRIW